MLPSTSQFDARIAVQPPLSAERLSDVPAARGVLALLDEHERPVTLITAADMRARLRSRLARRDDGHPRKAADLRTVTRAVCWTRTDGHFETDLAYLELARQLWPDDFAEMLAWKPAWFVRLDLDDVAPAFVATRGGLCGDACCVGPFPLRRAARRFVAVLEDAFDLCRDRSLLARAPHARTCPYGQMGRCLRVCDGSVTMDAYRRRLSEALDYAIGRREDIAAELRRRMQAASDALDFERAAALKARLDRLSVLNEADFHHVRPAERFQFVLIQPGGGRRRLRPFLVDGGRIAPRAVLDWPLKRTQLRELLAKMGRFVNASARPDNAGPWRVGLVAKYLFSAPQRRGLAVHWTDALDAAALTEQIVAARGVLGLSDRVGPDADER
ncbi:MAG: UvrB/UvrC motif-containing protein [Phycisphaerae bacterium]|nr:UvrB/UvrC motif-containing protein [Phycisphaerae bacterium]